MNLILLELYETHKLHYTPSAKFRVSEYWSRCHITYQYINQRAQKGQVVAFRINSKLNWSGKTTYCCLQQFSDKVTDFVESSRRIITNAGFRPVPQWRVYLLTARSACHTGRKGRDLSRERLRTGPPDPASDRSRFSKCPSPASPTG
jgi:hypothetical protein